MTVAAMWEARAAQGRGAELLAWAREQALPVPAADGPDRVELFTAPGERVLLISWWPDGVAPLAPPQPPAELLARPVHQWAFRSELVVEAG
ncbi:hypothetical protein ACFZB9_12250 [Kitasatospora sp. NPDC008050]|uniref:hypothetical protein n=1 Tax=Kitasatospora sp. NPDC008050 TaxID=3364021 RepID=UPI0036E4AB50